MPSEDIRVVEGDGVAKFEGLDVIRVETPSATYVLDKQGGGLAQLVDRDGYDWISFRAIGGYRGNFRGLPNLENCCHPGNPVSHPGISMETRVLSRSEQQVTVRSRSGDGRYSVLWRFWPDRAELTVEKAGKGPFSIAYQGTPGADWKRTTFGAVQRPTPSRTWNRL